METIEERKIKAEEIRLQMERNRKLWWADEHAFNVPDDVPDIPICKDKTQQRYYIDRLICFGAIKKDDLVADHEYLGNCRNSTRAIWNGTCFVYKRKKFGYEYEEEINHFEDDDGYDVFVPIKDLSK